MSKPHIVSACLSVMGVSLIVIALIIIGVTDKNSFIEYSNSNNKVLATSVNLAGGNNKVEEVEMETTNTAKINVASATQGDIYSGQTVEEIAAQLNKHLGNDMLKDKGELIAHYSISLGVDPYLATAVMLHESGCHSKCSGLTRTCYNVAGQKGAPSCNGGYKRYSSIDEGIKGAIFNLYKNYYAKGLNTVEKIGPRYAESSAWTGKINGYINKIKN